MTVVFKYNYTDKLRKRRLAVSYLRINIVNICLIQKFAIYNVKNKTCWSCHLLYIVDRNYEPHQPGAAMLTCNNYLVYNYKYFTILLRYYYVIWYDYVFDVLLSRT